MMISTIGFLLDFCATKYLIHWHLHWTILPTTLIFIIDTIFKEKDSRSGGQVKDYQGKRFNTIHHVHGG